MATYISYTPTTVIAKAMFNFDAFGVADYKLNGAVRVSVSDSFSYADYLSPNYSFFYSGLYTSGSNEVVWTTQMTNNIKDIIGIYSQFANITFEWKGNYDTNPPGSDSTPNPEDVGRAGVSDININWIYRPDARFAGISGGSSDNFIFHYTGGAGDIFLNQYAAKFNGDYTLDLNTRARQTLEHELGHSLGLSHPHSAYNNSNGVATITADYSATKDLGFDQLGFQINSAADMYKEYFTIMSYDDQQSFFPGSSTLFHAHTPMILDVIALQQAYGEGTGTSGSGNDTITAGTAGYRTYFDKGGIDTIDLSNYTDGAYLQMGVNIIGAAHLVGVSMSLYDGLNTILFGGDPAHLRWFYGEYENATGSSNVDVIFGNSLDNVIGGQGGDDLIYGGDGNDTLNGGAENDELHGEAGNDLLDWDANSRGGADTMYGGPGNDQYVIDSLYDVVVELPSEGTDLIWSEITYSIANVASVENLFLFGTQSANATGNALANVLRGNDAVNVLTGGAGNDTLIGGGGNDTLDGGAGIDTAIYTGTRGNFTITKTATLTVADKTGAEGTDTLTNAERMQFADKKLAFDLGGSAGNTAKLIGAAFGVSYLQPALNGIGIQVFDQGLSMQQVAELALSSSLFQQLAGSRSNAAVVTELYKSVVGVPPPASDLNYFVNLLNGGMSQADLLVFAANTDLNAQHVNLVGLASTGLEYV